MHAPVDLLAAIRTAIGATLLVALVAVAAPELPAIVTPLSLGLTLSAFLGLTLTTLLGLALSAFLGLTLSALPLGAGFGGGLSGSRLGGRSRLTGPTGLTAFARLPGGLRGLRGNPFAGRGLLSRRGLGSRLLYRRLSHRCLGGSRTTRGTGSFRFDGCVGSRRGFLRFGIGGTLSRSFQELDSLSGV
jgi:hypothetical protein